MGSTRTDLYCQHRVDQTVPIPGTKRTTYLEENGAARDVRLTADELERLDVRLPRGAAAGTRYASMGHIDR